MTKLEKAVFVACFYIGYMMGLAINARAEDFASIHRLCIDQPMSFDGTNQDWARVQLIKLATAKGYQVVPCDGLYDASVMYYQLSGYASGPDDYLIPFVVTSNVISATVYHSRSIQSYSGWTLALRPHGSILAMYRHSGPSLKGEFLRLDRRITKARNKYHYAHRGKENG